MSGFGAHFEATRRAEIALVVPLLEPGSRVLEIGGGSGLHARALADAGFRVTSVDLAGRAPAPVQHHPVVDYDGVRLPSLGASFDAVFSSNVLEHVADLPALLAETRRVLAPGGRAVHVVPSVAWRAWTLLAHYGYVVKRLLGGDAGLPGVLHAPSPVAKARERGWGHVLRRALFPGPHGEFPSALHELRTYRRASWRRAFQAAGFDVADVKPTGLFFTGYGLFPRWSPASRGRAARRLGSSGHVFLLRPRAAP